MFSTVPYFPAQILLYFFCLFKSSTFQNFMIASTNTYSNVLTGGKRFNYWNWLLNIFINSDKSFLFDSWSLLYISKNCLTFLMFYIIIMALRTYLVLIKTIIAKLNRKKKQTKGRPSNEARSNDWRLSKTMQLKSGACSVIWPLEGLLLPELT